MTVIDPPATIDAVDAIAQLAERGEEVYEQACIVGAELVGATDRNRWALGKLGNAIGKKYGEGLHNKFAVAIGLKVKTLYGYREVDRFYANSPRVENAPTLSWSHYREAMRLGSVDDARAMLEEAADADWTVETLEARITERVGGGRRKPLATFTAYPTACDHLGGNRRIELTTADDIAALTDLVGTGARVRIVAYALPEDA